MVTTRTIAVVNGAKAIESRGCRVMLLPDGRLGAFWRGLVFPIDAGDRIDVSLEGTPPSECQSHVTPASTGFAVVEGVEEAWLLVSGDVANRDLAAAQLRAAGYAVLRVGQWLGEPVDGFDGDWFVRFARPSQAHDLATGLAAVLDLNVAPARTPADLRLHLLQLEIAASHARERALQTELERTRRATSALLPIDESVSRGLEAELANERERRIAAEASLQEAEHALVLAKSAVSATSSINSLQPPRKPVRQIGREVEIAFEVLLSQIHPLRDSVVVASSEFRDRRSLYRYLDELQRLGGKTPPGWKKLQGADGWWERHVSNGEDDAGRLYGCFDSTARRWSILLSHKSEQDRDVAWLRKQ